jgi:LysM repeat protein
MNDDEDIGTPRRHRSGDERVRSRALGESDSGPIQRPASGRFRPVTTNIPPPRASTSSTPWEPATLPRRGPTRPAWENPPSQYDYPRLRGREGRRTAPTMWPVILAILVVALVLGVLVGIPALMGGGGNAAVASHSASPTVIHSGSGAPGKSAVTSPSRAPSRAPGPSITYTAYTVQPGDSLIKIMRKFGVERWEILLANPQITNPDILKVGLKLQIPKHGQLTQPPPTPSPTPTVPAP